MSQPLRPPLSFSSPGAASAQTYGFATLPTGSLSHVIASAISKAMKEKAGLNVLVQPAAGGNVIMPLVGARRGRDRPRQHHGGAGRARRRAQGPAHDRRRPGAAHAVLRPQGLGMFNHCRPQGQARDHGLFRDAQHRSGDARRARHRRLDREADVKPVLVPNVVRSADDFMAGNSRHVLLHLRRPEGARGRRHGRRHPAAGNRRERHAGGPQDHALGLSDRHQPWPVLTPASTSRWRSTASTMS